MKKGSRGWLGRDYGKHKAGTPVEVVEVIKKQPWAKVWPLAEQPEDDEDVVLLVDQGDIMSGPVTAIMPSDDEPDPTTCSKGE